MCYYACSNQSTCFPASQIYEKHSGRTFPFSNLPLLESIPWSEMGPTFLGKYIQPNYQRIKRNRTWVYRIPLHDVISLFVGGGERGGGRERTNQVLISTYNIERKINIQIASRLLKWSERKRACLKKRQLSKILALKTFEVYLNTYVIAWGIWQCYGEGR